MLEFTFAGAQPGPGAAEGHSRESPSCGLYLFSKSVGRREIEYKVLLGKLWIPEVISGISEDLWESAGVTIRGWVALALCSGPASCSQLSNW